jgi:hypothetical protein
MEFTKSERKQLRELASSVYEAEAHDLLTVLDAEFGRWRNGECHSSEPLGAIHEFHQQQSRELWSIYQGLSDAMVVERGLALGLIAESRVPAAILTKLRTVPSSADEQSHP